MEESKRIFKDSNRAVKTEGVKYRKQTVLDMYIKKNNIKIAKPAPRKVKEIGAKTIDFLNNSKAPEVQVKGSLIGESQPLSVEQNKILDIVCNQRKSVFFTGRAGTGKSFLLKRIIQALQTGGKTIFAVTASTGIAAYNIGGVTLHSFAGLGIGSGTLEELLNIVRRNRLTVSRWENTEILIIDEVSMLSADYFNKLNEVAKRLRKNRLAFGGMQVVLCGDFLQLPPVSKTADTEFIFESAAWKDINPKIYKLNKIFRQHDSDFIEILNEMRIGKLSVKSCNRLEKVASKGRPADNIAVTNLFPLRSEVDKLNAQKLKSIEGQGFLFKARDWAKYDTDLKKLDDSLLVPKEISLKIGCQVMLIKNMKEVGLFNGCIGKVEAIDLEKKEIIVNFEVHGKFKQAVIVQELFELQKPHPVNTYASRFQFPLILAYAMSIHKSQGQTIENVNVDMGKIFERGQAYVALSRCTSLNGLYIQNFKPSAVMAHPKVVEFHSIHQLD